MTTRNEKRMVRIANYVRIIFSDLVRNANYVRILELKLLKLGVIIKEKTTRQVL